MSPQELLLWGLGLGATAAGVTVAVRALKPVKKRMRAQQKPWACDVCMAFWTTAAVTTAVAAWRWDLGLVAAAGPAYPVALWTLRKLTDPVGPPPPPLEDSDA